MHNIRALIFDMDGVITDSEPHKRKAEVIKLQHDGIHIPSNEWNHFVGKSAKTIFEYIAEIYTDGSISAMEMMDYMRNMYLTIAPEKITLIKGAKGFLSWCRTKYDAITLTISSSKAIREIVFQKINPALYFDAIITGDDVLNGKPDPEPYLKTVEKLGEKAQYHIIIEDSDTDILFLEQTGCQTIGITTSFSQEKLRTVSTEQIVPNIDILQYLLQKSFRSYTISA